MFQKHISWGQIPTIYQSGTRNALPNNSGSSLIQLSGPIHISDTDCSRIPSQKTPFRHKLWHNAAIYIIIFFTRGLIIRGKTCYWSLPSASRIRSTLALVSCATAMAVSLLWTILSESPLYAQEARCSLVGNRLNNISLTFTGNLRNYSSEKLLFLSRDIFY